MRVTRDRGSMGGSVGINRARDSLEGNRVRVGVICGVRGDGGWTLDTVTRWLNSTLHCL